MQKIIPHLWFDKEAGEAAEFYTSIFQDSFIKSSSVLNNTPSGTVELLTIVLSSQEFMLISAGPFFQFTPAISFFISCSTKEEVLQLWSNLSDGGEALMPLDKYSFSELYGWIKDKFGLSWQVMYTGNSQIQQKIIPSLLFTGAVSGKAEEAINFYAAIFSDSVVDNRLFARYEKGEEPDKEGTVKYAPFNLSGQEFIAMDSAYPHDFTFNEAVSLVVYCDTQEEIDYYWDKLSYVPDAEQCGWLKDRYGVSWQIVPTVMDTMMGTKDTKQRDRVTEAFLKMKKFNISELKKAYEGKS